jgi:TolB-like protein
MKSATMTIQTGKHYFRCVTILLLLTLTSSGCASLGGSESIDTELAISSDNEEQGTSEKDSTETAKSEELVQAEQKVEALEQQLETLKVEWEQQKPALERLVSNEADLEFLVQALADMSQLADEPSRSQYLGQDELTPQKREESLKALQSLVSTQEELNTLLVELSTVVSEVASNNVGTADQGNAQVSTDSQASDTVATADINNKQAALQSPGTDAQYIETTQPQQFTSTAEEQSSHSVTTASMQRSADCNCTNSEPSSSVSSDPAKTRDPSWYAMTTPYTEAAPAGSSSAVSQLDSGAASGQPIPGLEVKTFKRRTLPSELAAAGADMQQYAMAPQFHMSRKSLSDYVSQLAFKLAGNQQLAGNRIGVASFVFFDEQLEQTSSVGNQLAEELSTVLPNYGARVIEYKLTREITVGPSGDLSLSRNTKKLRDSQGMDYVLTGTMVPTRRGLQINSRVVSTKDNVVIASATTLIPAMVLQQL